MAVASDTHVPIDTYILKVASRCNLNCRYCYMYNMGDRSYVTQPYSMSHATATAFLQRVATYCSEEGIGQIGFTFHGGEPLMAGKDFYRHFVGQAQKILLPSVTPAYSMQTNGTLLTREWRDLLSDLQISFGISLDGTEQINDANRVTHDGHGSYSRVRRAINESLADDRTKTTLFTGVLTVISLGTDPIEIYEHFKELGLPGCDFLLPDGTHDRPPAGLPSQASSTPYADWLIRLFDEWFDREDTSFHIRIFEDIIGLLFRPGLGNDSLGGGRNGIVVIEADGGIEPIDVLKICGDSFTKLGLNVHTNEIRDVYGARLMQLYHEGVTQSCDTCKSCPVVNVCGGGYLPHRYRSDNGFDNPTVYCSDLMNLITHVRSRVAATLPMSMRDTLRIPSMSYSEARALAGGLRAVTRSRVTQQSGPAGPQEAAGLIR
jgi:uncharacterized protein